MANKIFPEGIKEQILSRGVKDMPQNPASQGYTIKQIREFYYRPEEMIIDCVLQIEDHIVGENGTDERVVSLEEKITGENGLKDNIDTLIEKTKILNVDETKPNRFLSEDGSYKTIKECECVPIVVDKELNENSTNVVENQAIAKAIKGKQDKLTAGKNIKIENNVISAEGGSGGTDEIIKGTTAPTTKTVGDLGQFYTDTTSGTSYQCTSIVDGVYTWVKLIKATDIAQQKGNAGLIKLGSNSNGLTLIDGMLYIQPAGLAGLEGQYGGYAPVTAERLAYGVKQALINPDKSKAPANWTEEEQAKAMATLGKTAFLHEFVFTYDIETHAVYVVMDTVEKKGFDTFKNIQEGDALNIWGIKNMYENESINKTQFYKTHYTNELGESVYDIGIMTENDDYLIDENNFTLVSEKII